MKKLEVWGGIATAAYLAVMSWWVSAKWPSFLALELNELGDFLAGNFGPIAFLWLVLGFLQQGRELRLTSHALQLQVEELNRSVEQQTVMAKAATEQIKSQKAALDIQVWQHEQSISPLFEVQVFLLAGPYRDGETSSSIRITNRGAAVDAIAAIFESPLGDGKPLDVGRLDNLGVSEDIKFNYLSPDCESTGRLSIRYVRSDGEVRSSEYVYTYHSNGRIDVSKVLPAAA